MRTNRAPRNIFHLPGKRERERESQLPRSRVVVTANHAENLFISRLLIFLPIDFLVIQVFCSSGSGPMRFSMFNW